MLVYLSFEYMGNQYEQLCAYFSFSVKKCVCGNQYSSHSWILYTVNFFLCVLWWEHSRSTLSRFQEYSTILLTIITGYTWDPQKNEIFWNSWKKFDTIFLVLNSFSSSTYWNYWDSLELSIREEKKKELSKTNRE